MWATVFWPNLVCEEFDFSSFIKGNKEGFESCNVLEFCNWPNEWRLIDLMSVLSIVKLQGYNRQYNES